MSLATLCAEAVTTTHRTGTEDASGNAIVATSSHAAAFTEVTAGMRWAAQGTLPADAVLVVILGEGYGDTWELEPGDSVTRAGIVYPVVNVTAVTNPRTGVLSHIEAVCGGG